MDIGFRVEIGLIGCIGRLYRFRVYIGFKVPRAYRA